METSCFNYRICTLYTNTLLLACRWVRNDWKENGLWVDLPFLFLLYHRFQHNWLAKRNKKECARISWCFVFLKMSVSLPDHPDVWCQITPTQVCNKQIYWCFGTMIVEFPLVISTQAAASCLASGIPSLFNFFSPSSPAPTKLILFNAKHLNYFFDSLPVP